MVLHREHGGEADKISLENVQKLLDILLHDEPEFPTPEEVVGLRMDVDEVAGWPRTFRHRRRQLVWIFQTALRLGEEVVYSDFEPEAASSFWHLFRTYR